MHMYMHIIEIYPVSGLSFTKNIQSDCLTILATKRHMFSCKVSLLPACPHQQHTSKVRRDSRPPVARLNQHHALYSE